MLTLTTCAFAGAVVVVVVVASVPELSLLSSSEELPQAENPSAMVTATAAKVMRVAFNFMVRPSFLGYIDPPRVD